MSQKQNKIATESEVRELALIHNVEMKDVFPNTHLSDPYYEFNVNDQEFDSVQLRASGHLIGNLGYYDTIRNWIYNQLHTGNE